MKRTIFLFLALFTITVFSQPVNDNFSGAYDVTSLINSCSDVGIYTTEDATADLNAASCWNTAPNYNVWFKFQAPASGRIRVEIKRGGVYGSIREVNAAIWESDGVTEVSCNKYVYEEDNVIVQSLNLTPGQWYYISVDNDQAFSRGTFTLCLYDDVDYDFYEGAVDLTSFMNSCSDPGIYSTVGATPDRNSASCWNTLPNYNRWFKFQAPATGQIKVEIKRGGANGDIRNLNVAIWENDGITEVSCKRYIYSEDNVIVQSLSLTPGQWYYVSVDNASSLRRGSFTVCLYDQVDYDFYEGAYDVTSLIGSCSPDAAYTTHGYTADKNAASCWDASPTNNVWFKFQAPANGVIRAEIKRGGANGTLRNVNVALWEQDGVTELACQRYVDRNDNVVLQAGSLTPGQWYYISVDNSNLTYSGSFTLCLDDELDYDFYEGAYDITGYMNGCSDLAIYTTVGATPDRQAASCWDASPNYNRWFKFQAPATGMARIQIRTNNQFGTIQNINAAIWESDGVTEVACNRYVESNDGLVVVQAVGLTPGDWYYVSVDNYNDDAKGSFTLCIYDTVDYDFYEGAVDLTDIINSCSGQQAYNTKGATPDRQAASCWDAAPYYNRWFKFTANSDQITVTVRTGGSNGTIQRINLALWDTDGVTELACARYVNPNDTEVSLQYTGLTIGNVYYISVDNSTPESRGSFTICLEDGTMLWTGNVDGDWSKDGNWRPEKVPTTDDICIIPTNPEGRNFPTDNSQPVAYAKTLYIRPGAYVVVPNDHKLIIDKDLILESTGSTYTASIVDLNTDNQILIGGKAHVERFIVANNDYHYISSPMPNQDISGVLPSSSYRYYYEEPLGADNQMDGWQWATGNFEPARGYAVYSTNDFMLIFEGSTLNSGTYQRTVTLTDGQEIFENRGYNLLGNPYPSAIDANAFIDENSSVIEGTLYFWNDANGDGTFVHEDYATWNGSGSTGVGGGQRPNGKVAAHQGFMVKSQVPSGTVVFKNYMRDTENTQFFRPAQVLRRVRIQVNNDTYFSETLIAFRNDATVGFDPLYDGRKLASGNHLHLFTVIDSSWFAIQSLPESLLQGRNEVVVPLYLKVADAGSYVFSVNMFEQLDDYQVILRDKLLSIDTELGPFVSYRFYTDSGLFGDRFELIFQNRPLKEEEAEILVDNLYPNPVEDILNVQFSRPVTGIVEIIDLSGKRVNSYRLENVSEYEFDVNDLPKGIYILKLKSADWEKEYQFIKK